MSNKANSKQVVLPENFDIDSIESTHDLMVEALAEADHIDIDAAAVARVDYSAIQLLLAFSQALAVGGVSVSWQSTSEQLLSEISALGLQGNLGVG